MQMYVHYYDRKVKLPDENPTIGIILCRDKNNAVVEMNRYTYRIIRRFLPASTRPCCPAKKRCKNCCKSK